MPIASQGTPIPTPASSLLVPFIQTYRYPESIAESSDMARVRSSAENQYQGNVSKMSIASQGTPFATPASSPWATSTRYTESPAESSAMAPVRPSSEIQYRQAHQIETMVSNLTCATASTAHSPCKRHDEQFAFLYSLVRALVAHANTPQQPQCAQEVEQELTRLDRKCLDESQLHQILQLLQNMQHQNQKHDEMTMAGLDSIRRQGNIILRQNYELHQYPVPRLFIILPKVTRFRDRLQRPFYRQFKLHFLCECGEGDIHLAKHEGYDIHKPHEFLEKYGPYLRTIMQWLKGGLIASGIVAKALGLPPLPDLDIKIKSILEGTIEYLLDQDRRRDDHSGPDIIRFNSNELEGLEGVDLRRLQSYLVLNDKDQRLGNLFRTVTSDGHVKWVCDDHYRETYGPTGIQPLKDLVDKNKGTFLVQEGKIIIMLSSRKRASRFYEVLIAARGIQELDITLGWDATMNDLRKLYKSLTMTNIVSITVDGTYFKGPLLDWFNRKQRFSPLVHIAGNNRTQSMSIRNFTTFSRHVRVNLSTMSSQKLRSLSIQSRLLFKTSSVLCRVAELYPSLVEFTLECTEMEGSFIEFLEWASSFNDLKTVVFWNQARSLTISVDSGTVTQVEAKCPLSTGRHPDGLIRFATGRITRFILEPKEITPEMHKPLVHAIRDNPNLSEIQVHYHSVDAFEIINCIKDGVKSASCSATFRRLQLCIAVRPTADSDVHPALRDVINSTIEFTPAFKMSTSVQLKNTGERTGSWQSMTPYGWSIERLDANSTFNDDIAKVLERGADRRSPMLKQLALDPASLTDTGIRSLSRVIWKSDNLVKFDLTLYNLDEESEKSKLDPIFGEHLPRLTSLTARGKTASTWLERMKTLCPSRAHCPSLQVFHLTFVDDPLIPRDLAQWLVDMVSSPFSLALPSFPPSIPPSPILRKSASTSGSRTPQQRPSLPKRSDSTSGSRSPPRPPPIPRSLRKIVLKYLRLDPCCWKKLIESIDFTQLEELSFEMSNLSIVQLRLLARHIPDPQTVTTSTTTTTEVSLRSLNIRVAAVQETDNPELIALLEEFRRKVPCVITTRPQTTEVMP